MLTLLELCLHQWGKCSYRRHGVCDIHRVSTSSQPHAECSMITACMHCVCSLCVGLPEETLEGHRDRFNRQYSALRKYFNETRKMKYFDGLVEIPQLREVRSLHAHLADWFSQCQALHPGLIACSLPCEENSRDALLRLVARMSCVAYVLSNTHVYCLPSPSSLPFSFPSPCRTLPTFSFPLIRDSCNSKRHSLQSQRCRAALLVAVSHSVASPTQQLSHVCVPVYPPPLHAHAADHTDYLHLSAVHQLGGRS